MRIFVVTLHPLSNRKYAGQTRQAGAEETRLRSKGQGAWDTSTSFSKTVSDLKEIDK